MRIYAGEKATLSKTGKLIGITLGNGKNSAGDPVTHANMPTSLTMNTAVPNLNANSPRANGKLAEVIAGSLKATVVGDGQNASGALVLNIGDVRVAALPVGTVRVSPSRADGVTMRDNGLVEIAIKGVVTTFSPAVVDMSELAAALPSGSTLSVNGNGVLQVAVNGSTYFVRPTWYTSHGGASGLSANADQAVSFVDSKGNASAFKPAFANYDILLEAIGKELPTASAKVNADGTVSMTINGATYTLTPKMTKPILSAGSVPAVLAGKRWWQDADGKLFLNVGGMLQEFTVN